jgi:hypothetical protein
VTREEVLQELQQTFAEHLGADVSVSKQLVPDTVLAGKLYEAYVLSLVVERLAMLENYELVLVQGTKLTLKSSHGPINRKYPRIELRKNGVCEAELWTDVDFLTLSHSVRQPPTEAYGDYHELDLIVVEPGIVGRPRHDQIWLGVECKNTSYGKGLLKEILGVRREMSYLTGLESTAFDTWPRPFVAATPPSCLLVYATDPQVSNYAAPGEIFGIDFYCVQI